MKITTELRRPKKGELYLYAGGLSVAQFDFSAETHTVLVIEPDAPAPEWPKWYKDNGSEAVLRFDSDAPGDGTFFSPEAPDGLNLGTSWWFYGSKTQIPNPEALALIDSWKPKPECEQCNRLRSQLAMMQERIEAALKEAKP